MVKSKCLGCTERHIGCHSTCQSYQDYNNECVRIRNERRSNNIYMGYVVGQYGKAEKHKRQHGNT